MRIRSLVLVVTVLLSACAPASELTLPAAAGVPVPSTAAPADQVPRGVVRVAYPDEPARFVDVDGSDPAAVDLAALWGLPLFRTDDRGQRVRALAASVDEQRRDDGTFVVRVELRPGTWSDGTAVTSADVVATVEALRPFVRELVALITVTTPDARTVELTWDRPVAGWWQAVDAAGSILPASVLVDGGLDRYRDEVPVSGGPFVLAMRERGLSLSFRAHAGSPLGAPTSEGVDVLVTPSYETSLGLLEDGRVDAVLGHVALNPVPRGRNLAGVDAAAPLGGTTVTLEFRPGGGLGALDDAGERRGVVAAIRLESLVEGLLGTTGTPAIGPWAAGPTVAPALPGAPPEGQQLVTVLPRGHEVIGFTARAVQRDLEPINVDMQFVSFESPTFQGASDTQGGASFRIRRESPRPLLGQRLLAETPPDLAVDALAAFVGPGVTPGLQQVADEAMVVPLYRVGAAHVWRDSLEGFVPSSWPGLAFWSADEWRA